MATNEKKLAENEVEVVETTETAVEESENVTEEKKTSKVKAWFSKHKIGLTRVAKTAALIGGGLVAGLMIANKKKSKDEDVMMLDCGEWDEDDFDELPEDDESVEETPTEESEG